MTTRTSWDTACHLGAFRDFQTPNPAGVSKCRGTCTESTQICQRPMKHYGAFRESRPQTGGVPPNLSLKISNRILHDLAFWLVCISLPSQFLIQCNELDAASSITVFLLPVFLWSPDSLDDPFPVLELPDWNLLCKVVKLVARDHLEAHHIEVKWHVMSRKNSSSIDA